MYNTCTNLNSLPWGFRCSPMTVYVHSQGFAENSHQLDTVAILLSSDEDTDHVFQFDKG